MNPADVAEKLRGRFAGAIVEGGEFRGETSLTVSLSRLRDICAEMRGLGFDYLVDITSIDHFEEEPRFEIVYELYALADGIHFRLKARVEDGAEVPTVSDLWPTADWHEREIYDMMGIRFAGHPDLRRILMWEGYPYFPLRKDFPLEGRASDVPEVAFTERAPLAGGPFVTAPTDGTTQVREPRARRAGDAPPQEKFVAEP